MELKKIHLIIGIIIGSATIAGGVIAWERSLAYRSDIDECLGKVELVSVRLDQKILHDRIIQLTQRKEMMEDSHGGPGVPFANDAVKREYRHLLRDLEEAKRLYQKLGG